MITKNHKTTTVLVALAALSAILVVAGSVAAASDHAAFAHKKGVKNSGIAVPVITAQQQKCVAAGGTSPITGSCIATSTNTVTESGGIVR
jgi:uncharacterized membrane protein